jgi:LmbE family N-acetylglucosaminyl deacetylase
MSRTLLAIGAHYDDCVFGIGGILIQAVRKHYRVVILALIGDYTNWSPVKGREKELVDGTTRIAREHGAEMRFLGFASHRFDATLETKRAVAQVVAEVNPDVAFMLWHEDRHHDHAVASTVSKIALQHGDRVLQSESYAPAGTIYMYDNGPGHTIGFEPDVYVDITGEWKGAHDWLGKLMAVTRNQAYDQSKPDAAQSAKEALARFRGSACGVKYAEALRSFNARPRDIL